MGAAICKKQWAKRVIGRRLLVNKRKLGSLTSVGKIMISMVVLPERRASTRSDSFDKKDRGLGVGWECIGGLGKER